MTVYKLKHGNCCNNSDTHNIIAIVFLFIMIFFVFKIVNSRAEHLGGGKGGGSGGGKSGSSGGGKSGSSTGVHSGSVPHTTAPSGVPHTTAPPPGVGSAPPPVAPAANTGNNSSGTTGAIIGGTVGGVCGLSVLITAIVFLVKHFRKKSA